MTGAVLNEIVKDWDTANGLREQWFGPDSEAVLETIVTVALRSNPRQVKRLINLYLLIRHMEWESTADTSSYCGFWDCNWLSPLTTFVSVVDRPGSRRGGERS